MTTTPFRSRRSVLGLSAAALVLALGAGVMQPMPTTPALAQSARPAALSQAQLPSFADVVDEVRGAVISVRATTRIVQSSETEDLDIPPGHPLERFLRPEGRTRPGERGERPRGRERGGMSQGSGFFISADGYAVTNNHVVEGASEVELISDDGKTFKAKVIGTDPRTDLALLKAETTGALPFVRLAKGNPRIGDWVIAVGNPFGLGGTVTAGIVSARGRDIGAGPYDDFLQIDAAVNRGNSGGPTFNLRGEVVGVNTAIASPSGGNVGIAFAIPAATVETVIEQLKSGGQVARGFLGVQIQPVTPEIADAIGLKEARGALVAQAETGSPAGKAGLKRGDTILSLDGAEVKDPRELTRRVGQLQPGATVALKVWRDGAERTLKVELGRQPRA